MSVGAIGIGGSCANVDGTAPTALHDDDDDDDGDGACVLGIIGIGGISGMAVGGMQGIGGRSSLLSIEVNSGM